MPLYDYISEKIPLPTELGSEAIKASWSSKIREAALFSAKTSSKTYLEKLKTLLNGYINGDNNKAEIRARLIEEQEALGMPIRPSLGEPNPIVRMQNISSKIRQDLIIETARGQAASMAKVAASQDPVQAVLYPAWKLKSGSFRKNHRDWANRWAAAGAATGWVGASQSEMIALKESPIWQALGEGAGGYSDTLGTAYPPFAFQSSYNWVDVPRAKAKELGLI